MVIDENEEGFPIAFCLTSSVCIKTMEYFFSKIKDILKETKSTKVFMSDDMTIFYKAWKSVFGGVEVRLLCAWHVDRAWQGHLNTIPLDKRNDVYKMLKSITYELDQEIFCNTLTEFVTKLKNDPDTKICHDYFVKFYCERTTMWAYCFRKGARLNTNMHVENFHWAIKHIYLEGKKCKRVDKCCIGLETYIGDKEFDVLVKKHKGKITKKHTVAFRRHKERRNITSDCLQNIRRQLECKIFEVP